MIAVKAKKRSPIVEWWREFDLATFICDWIVPHDSLRWRILRSRWREVPNAARDGWPRFACRRCGRISGTMAGGVR